MAGESTVVINELQFTYPGIDGAPPPGAKPLIHGFSMRLSAGDRCLLVGANGAGKTTLLKIIGGKHMVDPDMVRVLGKSTFHDTALVSSGSLSYLGGEWRRDVAFAGFDVPLQMDVLAEKMIFGVQGIDPARRKRLIEVLDIDLTCRLHKVSDGQRRRVQICMGLLRPFKWRRDVAFAGFDVPLQMDVLAEKMIFGVQGIDPARRKRLIEVLDIDLTWRLHKVSDGQRRRVQICMGLLRPFKVLLLDEITVDLDVLARADLLALLTSECKERGATIIYATHIFDGLGSWPTHIVCWSLVS